MIPIAHLEEGRASLFRGKMKRAQRKRSVSAAMNKNRTMLAAIAPLLIQAKRRAERLQTLDILRKLIDFVSGYVNNQGKL